ncbi:hypothetical protein HDU92_003130 [Lobulomyces angularis]|nr:hypothetical protein HDU92_003130 [Lobulomyces angularis]
MLLSNEWYVQKLRCMEACATSADECLQVKGDLFRFTNTKVFFQDLLLKDSTFTSNNLNCTISNIEKWQNDMKMLDLLAYPVLTLMFINGLVVHTVSSNLIDHISLGNIFQSNTSKVDIATSKKIMEVNNDKNEVNKLSSRPSNRKLNKLSD